MILFITNGTTEVGAKLLKVPEKPIVVFGFRFDFTELLNKIFKVSIKNDNLIINNSNIKSANTSIHKVKIQIKV